MRHLQEKILFIIVRQHKIRHQQDEIRHDKMRPEQDKLFLPLPLNVKNVEAYIPDLRVM